MLSDSAGGLHAFVSFWAYGRFLAVLGNVLAIDNDP